MANTAGGGFSYFSIGEQETYDDPHLFDALGAAGFRTPPYVYRTFGGGGFYQHSSGLLIGGEGEGGGLNEDNDGGTLAVGAGHGGMRVGWRFTLGRLLSVYPLIGIGGAGAGVSAEAIEDGSSSALVSVGLGIDLRLGGRVGLLLGLRVGWYQPLGAEEGSQGGFSYYRPVIGVYWEAKTSDDA